MCPTCETANRPTHRYCDRCWNLRPDWLPSSGAVGSRPMTDADGGGHLSRGGGSRGSGNSLDSGVRLAAAGGADHSDNEHDAVFPASSEVASTNSAVTPPSAAPHTMQSTVSSSSVCVVCLAAPKNASIVHGSTGHQACCFQCARRLKRTRQHCPVCRRPIHRVIRNYLL